MRYFMLLSPNVAALTLTHATWVGVLACRLQASSLPRCNVCIHVRLLLCEVKSFFFFPHRIQQTLAPVSAYPHVSLAAYRLAAWPHRYKKCSQAHNDMSAQHSSLYNQCQSIASADGFASTLMLHSCEFHHSAVRKGKRIGAESCCGGPLP